MTVHGTYLPATMVRAMVFAAIVTAGSLSACSRTDVSARSPRPSTPQSTTSTAAPTAGRNLGLGFAVCRTSTLGGLDLGGVRAGRAWTGTVVNANGRCPRSFKGKQLLAVDVDGDRIADTWSAFTCRGGCDPQPFAGTDLNADGVDEVVVLVQPFSAPDYEVFALSRDGARLAAVTTGGSGHPANGFIPGRTAVLSSGGDAGIVDFVRCLGYPTHTVIVQTRSFHPPDGPGSETTEVHVTWLRLLPHATFDVLRIDDFTLSSGDPLPGYTMKPACGVDWNPGPPF